MSGGLLDFATILSLAERESGAFDLAGEGLKSRVAALVERINERGPYTPDQLRAMLDQIRRMLATRLKVLLDRQSFPAIAEEKIERPVFIIGFPRAGTTLLHSLLAEDPDVLKPQGWHMFSPSPPPGAEPMASERIAFADRMIAGWMDFCPAQKSMHPYIDKGAFQLIEDDELFSLDFHNAYPYHFYRVPSLDPSFVALGSDDGEALRFHRDMLQHLQWNSAKSRWVCKSPSAQMRLDALFEVYPDALCVWPHRPYGEIFASNVALRAAIFDTIQGRAIDWKAMSEAMAQGMAAAVDGLIDSDGIDDPRILHLKFAEVAKDPVGVVRRVYERQGMTLSADIEARVRGWLADPANDAARYGRYPYSYERFGLDRARIESMFARYSQRFGLE